MQPMKLTLKHHRGCNFFIGNLFTHCGRVKCVIANQIPLLFNTRRHVRNQVKSGNRTFRPIILFGWGLALFRTSYHPATIEHEAHVEKSGKWTFQPITTLYGGYPYSVNVTAQTKHHHCMETSLYKNVSTFLAQAYCGSNSSKCGYISI